MATTEQWHSREREFIEGPDGIVRTETRYFFLDDADADTWMPPDGGVITIANRWYFLTRAKLTRHAEGTKATAEVVYSESGIKTRTDVIGKKEYFFRSAGAEQRKTARCVAAQHPNVVSVPSAQMILGYTTWLKQIPSGDLYYIGKINMDAIIITALSLTVPEYSLLMMAPDAHRVGEEKWRITRQWIYNPDKWIGRCQVDEVHTGGDNRRVYLYTSANMGSFFR